MLTIFEQLAQIKEVGRRREKVVLLRRHDSPTLRDTLIYAFSPAVSFGVKRVTFDSLETSVRAVPPSIGEFLQLCMSLAERTLHGPDAWRAVQTHVHSYPARYRDLVADFFSRTLTLGTDLDVVNEAFPGTLPIFGLQVAREFHADKLTYPNFAHPALGGVRCLVFVTRHGIRGVTASGKQLESIPHIERSFRDCPLGVYDGVLLHENGVFHDTLTPIMKPAPTEESAKVKFNVVDFISLAEWGKPVTPASERFKRLWDIYEKQYSRIAGGAGREWFVVHHQTINNNQDLLRYHDEMLSKGWDGTVVQADKPYKHARTYHQMRLH